MNHWVERLRITLVLIVMAAPSRAASSQEAAREPWALFSVRYDTRTSDFIYAVYGYGDGFGMVAVLHNPRSNYSEVLGGSATVALQHGVELGAATDLSAAKGQASSIAAGPELRLNIPKAVIGIDVQRVLNTSDSRLRVFFLSSF